MKENTVKQGSYTSYVREFNSLNDFEQYITNTPLNAAFQWESLHSTTNGYDFTQTHSYDEAVKLFENGWQDMAQQLTKKLDVIKNQVVDATVQKIMYDVVGFQASVPRYLQGIPTNMVNKKQVVVKQRVITLNKDISYHAGITTEQIVEASVQTLQLIKKIEAQGIRVNLNLIFGATKGYTKEVIKIKLKSANERLNISKLAFPLVHPSMLRRLLFRYIEVAPTVTPSYVYGYGKPLDGTALKTFCKDEYVLPRLFSGNITELGNLAEICNLTDKVKLGENGWSY